MIFLQIAHVVDVVLTIYSYLLLASVLASYVIQSMPRGGSGHPILVALDKLTSPVVRPLRDRRGRRGK